MARGWESKSVEDQQAEATRERGSPKTQLSPDQIVRERELEGLRLSRARVLQLLEVARDPHHRQSLEAALADLDRRMRTLQTPT